MAIRCYIKMLTRELAKKNASQSLSLIEIIKLIKQFANKGKCESTLYAINIHNNLFNIIMIPVPFVKDAKKDIAKHVTCNNYYYNNYCE